MSFNARLRALVGIRPGGAVSSSLRNAGQIEVFGAARRPGPFETPPAEEVRLEHPLPWELQEDGSGAVADWVNRIR